MLQPSPNPPISVDDFARIHGVIRGVLSGINVSAPDISKSCVFFALAGAYLLHRKHDLDAMPAAGAAFIAVSGRMAELDILSFAKRDEESGCWCSDADAFHAWVQVTTDDGQVWIIDFTSPLYADGIRKLRPSANPGFKAFMRPAAEMLSHPDCFQKEGAVGDFFMEESRMHTAHLMRRAAADQQVGDLIDIVNEWYVRAPARPREYLRIGSNDGCLRELRFKPPRLAGLWSTELVC
ncbi:DUF2026 domain-containing protein [Paracidovorax citrulli]